MSTIEPNPMDTDAEELRSKLLREGSLMIDVKVIPRARAGEAPERMADGALRVKVTAIPEKGKANEEVCAVLAAYLGVPKSNVDVVRGRTSQRKRLRVRL
jgi:uncharacterized protein YggU (UPF0235/DUF167 family)